MKFLHTADWHVGKVLRGRSRLDEQRQVLAEIVAVARREEVDAVLVAGDLFDSATPTADAEALVIRTLTELRAIGAEVIAIAGNHDPAAAFDAYRPLTAAADITLVGRIRRADLGGVVSFTARSTGERVNVAVLPFLSQRYAVSAAQLVSQTPAESSAGYDQFFRTVLEHLCTGFTSDAVNIVMAHVTVTNGTLGGGERAAQSIFEYHVPASVFPGSTHYVALGHLHRRQTLPAACPVNYSGAPYAIDFGEGDNTAVVLVVQATPTTPATITEVPITAGRRLRTVTGTVASLTPRVAEFGDDFLRVNLRERYRAGLTEEVRDLLANVLVITIDPEFAAQTVSSTAAVQRAAKSPGELVQMYCDEHQITDTRLVALFNELADELAAGAPIDAVDPAATDLPAAAPPAAAAPAGSAA